MKFNAQNAKRWMQRWPWLARLYAMALIPVFPLLWAVVYAINEIPWHELPEAWASAFQCAFGRWVNNPADKGREQ